MEKEKLDTLVTDRKNKCDQQFVIIDMIQQKAKGYCKARDFRTVDRSR